MRALIVAVACVGIMFAGQPAWGGGCGKTSSACCPQGRQSCCCPKAGAACGAPCGPLAGRNAIDLGGLDLGGFMSGLSGLKNLASPDLFSIGSPALLAGSATSAPRLADLFQFLPTLALVATTDSEQESQGWLGVVMSPLPEPLAAQLELEDLGLMIINVMEESPADLAGLQQYDVLLELDGQNLTGDFEEFGGMVRDHQPGDRVELRIVRGAEPMTLVATLGERPEKPGLEYLYELQPHNIIKQELKGLGRIIRRDDLGNWVVEDLGEIEDFSPLSLGLPPGTLPGLKSLSRSWCAELDTGAEVTVKRQEDDQVLEVRRSGGSDSPIVVKRSWEEDGEEVVEEKTYRDADELKEADAEAYDLYNSARDGGIRCRIRSCVPGLKDLSKLQKEWTFEIQRSIEENEPTWRGAIDIALEAARESQDEALEAARDALQAHEDQLKNSPLLRRWGGKWQDRLPRRGGSGTSITVQPDGEIHVTTRKGGTTLKRIFRDAEELREQDESLFDRYQELLEEEEIRE